MRGQTAVRSTIDGLYFGRGRVTSFTTYACSFHVTVCLVSTMTGRRRRSHLHDRLITLLSLLQCFEREAMRESGREGESCCQYTAPNTLLPTHCSQHTAPNTLLPIHCSQHIAPNTLLPTHCSQHTAPNTPFPTNCAQHTAPNTLFPTHCSQHTAPNTLLPTHCSQHTAPTAEKVKLSSYTAQYPIVSTAQSDLHVTPWQTCSIKHHLDFSGKYLATLQLMRKDYSYANIHHCHKVLILAPE